MSIWALFHIMILVIHVAQSEVLNEFDRYGYHEYLLKEHRSLIRRY